MGFKTLLRPKPIWVWACRDKNLTHLNPLTSLAAGIFLGDSPKR
jgi:hypothetical protein